MRPVGTVALLLAITSFIDADLVSDDESGPGLEPQGSGEWLANLQEEIFQSLQTPGERRNRRQILRRHYPITCPASVPLPANLPPDPDHWPLQSVQPSQYASLQELCDERTGLGPNSKFDVGCYCDRRTDELICLPSAYDMRYLAAHMFVGSCTHSCYCNPELKKSQRERSEEIRRLVEDLNLFEGARNSGAGGYSDPRKRIRSHGSGVQAPRGSPRAKIRRSDWSLHLPSGLTVNPSEDEGP